MREFFTRGRNQNIDSFYLCQSYYKVPKHGIRDNANLSLAHKHKDLRLLYEDLARDDMEFEEFINFCQVSWMKFSGFGFIVIDITKDVDSGRYWDNFEEVFIPNSS